MTTPLEEMELQAWRRDWTAPAPQASAPQRLKRHVRGRSRVLRLWIAGDTIVGLAILVFVTWAAVTLSDPLDRLAMALFAIITIGAIGFAYWNWLGARPPEVETTATFLALSDQHCRLIARAVGAAWVILAAETVVFVPFLAYNVGSPAVRPGPWLYLTGMLALGAVAAVALGRWSRREAEIVAELRRETSG